MKVRPENFEPPYPAFTCELFKLRPNVTLGQIALQYRDGEQRTDVARLQKQIEACLIGPSAPWRREQCTHVDALGYRNDITLAYWRHREDFQGWRHRTDVVEWADTIQPVGVWIEALTCPIPQMETSYSTEEPAWGIAPRCPVDLDPDHGYFGAMRDRIPAAEDRGLTAELDQVPEKDLVQETEGRHLRIDLPGNMCFIRTVQGWRECGAEQLADYENTLAPVYHAGVEYLRDHPRASNCVSARLVDMLDPDAQIQTQTLAWFLGLEYLELWAHEHPTHHAILNGMTEFAQRYNLDIDLVLGHEVYVTPKGYSHVEYSNCHPATGFLRFFAARPT